MRPPSISLPATKRNRRVLSGSALDALREFYTDRDARQKQFEDLKAVGEESASSSLPLSMNAFQENWNESQFWVWELHSRRLKRGLADGLHAVFRRDSYGAGGGAALRGGEGDDDRGCVGTECVRAVEESLGWFVSLLALRCVALGLGTERLLGLGRLAD